MKDVDLKTLPLLELSFDGNGRTLRTFAAKSPQRVAPRRPARCLAARVEVSAPLRAPMHGNQGDPAVEDVLCGVVLTLDSATPVRARTLRVGPLLEARVAHAAVGAYIEDLTPPEERERGRERHIQNLLARPHGEGRPTKRERRAFEKAFRGPYEV